MTAMKEPEGLVTRNAVITNADIRNNEEPSYLTIYLNLDYGEGRQGVAGFTFYLSEKFTPHEFESLAGHFIWRVMEIAEVTQWSELKGKTIRVRQNWSVVWEIGHIVKDDWFCPAKDFEPVIEKNRKEAGHD
jgi:hypothetical protein